MLYSYIELKQIYKNDYQIGKAISSGKIHKIERGLFTDEMPVNPLLVYCRKYPSAIVSMNSAFYYYELTDVVPQKVYLATPENYRHIANEQIEQIFVPLKKLNQGKRSINIDNGKINIYDKERLLVELVRRRNRIPFDYYKEIILNYRNIAETLDTYKIDEYLSLYKKGLIISDVLSREVF